MLCKVKMKSKPIFSVLIANYNNGQYLEECLQSIFAQTYKNWEIIIVDDASTDNSWEFYQKYANDQRIRVYYNSKNKGCGYTKRKCVGYAAGEICGFVDPDDIIDNEALEILIMAHIDNPGHSIIYSTHYICDKHLKIDRVADYVGQIPENSYSWENRRPIISQFATFKLSKYNITPGISSFLQKAVDKDLYYKLENTGPVKLINKPLYYYRQHPKSISLNQNASIAYQYHLTIKALILINSKDKENTLNQMPHTKTQLAGAFIVTGLSLLHTQYAFSGLTLLSKSLIFFPLQSFLSLPKIFYRFVLRKIF
jgi:glycosyltransferase involved in cell wall biosynthesis